MSMGPVPQKQKKTLADFRPPYELSRVRAKKHGGSFRPIKHGAGRDKRGNLATKKHTLGRLRLSQKRARHSSIPGVMPGIRP